jgi:sigma-B regulation protein RsbU (phosphoserine phosphatase)
MAAKRKVLICLTRAEAPTDLRQLLAGAGYTVAEQPFDVADPAGHHLIVVEGCQHTEDALNACRQLRARLDDHVVPILFIFDDNRPESRRAGFEAGADACLLRPFAPAELLAQAAVLHRFKDTQDRLGEKSAEIQRANKRLQQAHQQIDREMELAQRIQTSFLPQTLPNISGSRFAVHYQLCGRVGGDFYDVFRLDENHVGFFVADAMGHGVPASLLTIFVKKGVRAKEVFGKQYRLVPPGEVLEKLNAELIEAQLSGHPFITMAYGLLNHRDATLEFARAGHPYPLYVPQAGELELWRQHGLLLGVADAYFPPLRRQLRPGDKVLFYTDGLDGMAVPDHAPGAPSLLAAAQRHRRLPVDEFVSRLARDLRAGDSSVDDLTLLGLEIRA